LLASTSAGIFFVQRSRQGDDLRVAVQGVGVEVELGVQRDQVALAVAVQRVDFHQRGVGVHVAGVELLEHVGGLLAGCSGQADAGGDLQRLFLAQTGQRIDQFGDDFLGGAVRDLFDVHATFAGRDHGHFLGGAVGHQGHVVLFLDVGAVFDVEATHFLAFRAGLMRLELHAQDVAGQALDVVNRLGHLDAATLATAAGVDLRLDHPHGAAQFLGGFHRLLHRERRDAARHRHTELTQDFLALVLVNLHEVSLRSGFVEPLGRTSKSARWHWTQQRRNVSCCNAPNWQGARAT
jgi:hypothetical protein